MDIITLVKLGKEAGVPAAALFFVAFFFWRMSRDPRSTDPLIEIRGDVRRIRQDVGDINTRLAHVEGQLTAKRTGGSNG